MKREFCGNQYSGRYGGHFKLVLSRTWIGLKETYHNHGKVTLAVLMLGLTSATFIHTSTPHKLWIASAYADLITEDKVEYVRAEVEVPEEILFRIKIFF